MEKDDIFFKINLCFKLPKDFAGDVSDALQEIIKYRDLPKAHNDKFVYDETISLYANWWNMVNTTDKILLASVSSGKFNGKEFIDLDLIK